MGHTLYAEGIIRRLVQICAIAVAGIAVAVWITWLFGGWRLTSFGGGGPPMAPSTAVLFVALSSALLLQIQWPQARAIRALGATAAGLALLVVALVAARFYLNIDVPLEQWLIGPTTASIPVGRMAPLTAVFFLASVVAQTLHTQPLTRRRHLQYFGMGLSLATFTGSLLVLYGYAANAPFQGIPQTNPMALATALEFFLLSLGLILAATDKLRPASPPTGNAQNLADDLAKRFNRMLAAAFAILATAITVAGFVYLKHQQSSAYAEIQDYLRTVADLKAEQIASWRNEQLINAEFLSRLPSADALKEFLARPHSPAARERMAAWLNIPGAKLPYPSVRLFDGRHRLRLEFGAPLPSPDLRLQQLLDAAARSKTSLMSDLHVDATGDRAHLDLVVPVAAARTSRNPSTAASPAIASIVLQIDAEKSLFPLLARWPIPSRTAEMILFRQDGDHALYLSRLRHEPDAPLNKRIPLTRTKVPAVRTIVDAPGLFEGLDYRNLPVLAVTRPIPGTPWFLLAKIDQAEVNAPLRSQSLAVGVVIVALLLATSLASGLLWRQRIVTFYRRALQQELDSKVLEERVAYLMQHANDIILLWGEDGNIQEANTQALETFGYSLGEIQALTLHDLQISDAIATAPSPDAARNSLETTYRRKDGSQFVAEISIGSVEINGVRYYQGIIRDITRRKQMEERLRAERNLLRTLIDSSPDYIFFKDTDSVYLGCNKTVEGLFGRAEAEIIGKTDFDLFPEATAKLIRSADQTLLARCQAQTSEDQIAGPNGEPLYVEALKAPLLGIDGTPIGLIGIARDITERKRIQLALQESEERWSFALEGAGEGVWDWNIETGAIVYSSRYKEMLGYARDENWRCIDDWKERVNPDDLTRAMIELETYLDGKRESYSVEYRMRCRDGSWKWIQARGMVSRSADGRPTRMIGTHTDITQRKQAEDALRRSEEDLRLLLNSAAEAIYGIDADGNCTFCNPSCLKLLGYRHADELIGKSMHRLIHHSRADGTPYAEPECRIHQALANAEGTHVADEIFWRADGTYFPVEYWSHPQFRDERIIGAVVTFLDITERMQDQEDLLKLSRAVENSPAVVIIANTAGEIEYVNRKFTEVTGFQRHEALGKNPRMLSSGLHAKTFYEELWSTVLAGNEWHGELHNRKKNGDLFIEAASISPIRDDAGHITHLVAVKEDVTERRLIENRLQESMQAAEAANRAKSEFLANMSHEIRTPMNAIIGLSHLCLQTALSATQHDYLQKIYNASSSLLRIINDILDVSKIEAGKLELERTPFELGDVLSNLTAIYSLKAREKNLELQLQTAPRVPTYLIGDPLRLEQVLSNLVGNAVKFTPRGEVLLQIELADESAEQATLRFNVRDSGIGMSAAQQAQLFQPFAQGDASITRQYGGTGLGLVICKRIVGMMGGDIGVSSVAGQGTQFTFTAVFGKLAEPPETALLPAPDLRGLSVLVVCDNDASRHTLDVYLQSFTFRVTLAINGVEALAEMAEARQTQADFDLLILDWRAESADAIAVAQTLRRPPAPGKTPRLLLISSAAQDILRADPGHALFDDVLEKPYQQSELLEIITRIFMPDRFAADGLLPGVRYAPETLSKIRGAKLLLVEDNEVNMIVARDLLRNAGITVAIAENGREALECLARERFDGVLMDLQMPVLDGIAATREIRQQPQFEDLPIIAMTANATPEDRRSCLAAGMNDHIAKPIDPYKVFATLAAWISPAHPVAAAETQAPGNPEALPLLPDVKVRESVQRMGGNVATYYDVLATFRRNQQSVVAEIRGAIASGDHALAVRRAHTLKGLAGSLGAYTLQSRVQDLEARIRECDWSAANALLTTLQGELDTLFSAIDQSLAHRIPQEAATVDKAVAISIDRHELARLIGKADLQFKQFDTGVELTMTEIRNLVQNDPAMLLPLISLETHLRSYDYEKGRAELLVWAAALGLSVGDVGHE